LLLFLFLFGTVRHGPGLSVRAVFLAVLEIGSTISQLTLDSRGLGGSISLLNSLTGATLSVIDDVTISSLRIGLRELNGLLFSAVFLERLDHFRAISKSGINLIDATIGPGFCNLSCTRCRINFFFNLGAISIDILLLVERAIWFVLNVLGRAVGLVDISGASTSSCAFSVLSCTIRLVHISGASTCNAFLVGSGAVRFVNISGA
jgi:hypothetical protein